MIMKMKYTVIHLLTILSIAIGVTKCGDRKQIQRYNLRGDYQVDNAKCEEFYRFFSDNTYNHFRYCFDHFRVINKDSFIRLGIFQEQGGMVFLTEKGIESRMNLIRRGNGVVVLSDYTEEHKALILRKIDQIPDYHRDIQHHQK